MHKTILKTAFFLGLLAVILGAFGSHALKQALPTEALRSFEVGVRYQFYHAFLLLYLASGFKGALGLQKKVFWLVVVGIILFSGSIYLLATNTLSSFFDFKTIGFITPIGGSLLITAWFVLFLGVFRKKVA